MKSSGDASVGRLKSNFSPSSVPEIGKLRTANLVALPGSEDFGTVIPIGRTVSSSLSVSVRIAGNKTSPSGVRMRCGASWRILRMQERRFRLGAVARNPWQGDAARAWPVGISQPGAWNAAGHRVTRSVRTSRSNGAQQFCAEARATSAPTECSSSRTIRFGLARGFLRAWIFLHPSSSIAR